MNTKKIIILVLTVLIPVSTFAGIGTEGTTGMQFLNISADARGSALSDAVSADVNGVRSIYYNPAGLNILDGADSIVSYNKWIAGMNYIYAGFATSKFHSVVGGNVGMSITFMNEGELSIVGIEDTGNYSLKSSDIGINLAYAIMFGKLKFGSGLKFVNKSLFGLKSSGVVLDIGSQMNLNDKIKLGVVLKNIGFSSAPVKESDMMPMRLDIGGNYRYIFKNKNIFNLLMGINLMIDDMPIVNVGTEYVLKNILFLRMGYRLPAGGNRVDKYNGLSFGLGIVSKKLSIDFSIVPMGILGNIIEGSIGMRF